MAVCRIESCTQDGNPTEHGPECHIHQAHQAMRDLIDGAEVEQEFNSGGTWCYLVNDRKVAAHRAVVAMAMGRPLAHGQRERVYRLRKDSLHPHDMLLETVGHQGRREYVSFDEHGKRRPTLSVPPPEFKGLVGGTGVQRRSVKGRQAPVNQLDPDAAAPAPALAPVAEPEPVAEVAGDPAPASGGLTTEQMARIYLAAAEQGQTVQQYLAAQFTA